MKMILPKEVTYILDILYTNNFEGYIVGGCVRDSLLNKEPKDWDITTSALPEQIISLFEKTIPTGLKHGTVTVIINNKPFEITTYRIDGEYSNNRHPDEVTFTSSLFEDLSRRDFTVNAMAYNHLYGIQDPFKGMASIEEKVIRCVGNADKRFNEDALRMLRAIRFSSQLGFSIDENTFISIINNHHLISNVSAERIRDELSKILISPQPSNGIKTLEATKLLSIILPELQQCKGFEQKNPHHDLDVFNHIMHVLDNTPPDLIIRLAALLHDIGKPHCFSLDEKGVGHFYKHDLKSADMCETILKRLRFDNSTIKKVCILVKEHMSAYNLIKSGAIKRFINRVGVENLDNLFELQLADIKGHKHPHDVEAILKIKEAVNIILQEKQPLSIKDLKINGNDLIKIGFTPGKNLGLLLQELLDLVLQNPELNSREQLLDLAAKMLPFSETENKQN